MKTITFSTNSNNKLDCQSYTTLQLRNDDLFIPGAEFEVKLGIVTHHVATVVAVKHLTFSQLNEYIARLDSGESLADYSSKLLHFYGSSVRDSVVPNLSLLLMAKKDLRTNDKIALFCRYYEQFEGVKYKISPAETKMIQAVEVTELLLQTYFTSVDWWAKMKSVTYYVKNYNEIRRMALAPAEKKAAKQWPREFTLQYYTRLQPREANEWFKFLRSLGLEAKKDRFGNVIDFVKKKDEQSHQ